jgi:LPXTG-site transpeptidase (sortase) family protein
VTRRLRLVAVAAAVAAAAALAGCGSAAPAPVAGPPTSVAAPTTAAATTADVPVLPASDPVRVRVPAIGVDSPLMDLGLQPDGSLEVPAEGFPAGWFTGSPTPGEIGPAVLAGHVDWAGSPGVFVDLDQLQAGDQVLVDRVDGSTATFVVTRVDQVAKADFPTAEVYGDIGNAGLRLITCGGEFDRSTGDYLDDVVVFADMVA